MGPLAASPGQKSREHTKYHLQRQQQRQKIELPRSTPHIYEACTAVPLSTT